MKNTEIEVPAALDGERLDRVVAMVTGVSRAIAAALVDGGSVEVDGEVERSVKRRVADGTRVRIELPANEIAGVQADPTVVVEVVYEDADVVVVDKPPGVVVHPGAGNPTGTLVNGLLARFPEIAGVGDPARPGIVHRLDKGTSGLLVVARSSRGVRRARRPARTSVGRASLHDPRVGEARAGDRGDRRAGGSFVHATPPAWL